MHVVVRDRAAEHLDGPAVTRALTVSAFCSRCCVRRGPVTVTTRTDYRLRYTVQASRWENRCGDVDTDEDIITAAELSCAAVGAARTVCTSWPRLGCATGKRCWS
jgi:hypothetical protein